MLGSIQLVKEEYMASVEKRLKADYDEVVFNFEGYVKVIEKLEKVEKFDKLTKSAQQLVQDVAGILKDAKGQTDAQEIVSCSSKSG